MRILCDPHIIPKLPLDLPIGMSSHRDGGKKLRYLTGVENRRFKPHRSCRNHHRRLRRRPR